MSVNKDEDKLRDALRARADIVEVGPDALPRIRQRIEQRRKPVWPVFAVAAAVAAVIAVAVVVFVPDRVPPVDGMPAASATPTAVQPAHAVPSLPSPVVAPLKVQLPVYYARNDRLVREFHELTLTGDGDAPRIAAAVAESLRAGSPFDPDYRSLWPDSVVVRSVSLEGRVVTVDLSEVGTGPRDGTPQLAVQQLVSTVAASASYTTMKRADGVRLLVDGNPVAKLWNQIDTSKQLRQAAIADVYAPVWVIDPQQGQQVGKTFTVHLAGIVVEGSVQLRVRGGAGQLVAEQTVQLSAGAPAMGEARVQLTLPAGRYVVEAYHLSAIDGSIQGVDDHEFSVG